MAIGFHSVVIDVADLTVGVRDFARLLGIAPIAAPDPAQAARGATFGLSNMCLELRSSVGSASLEPPGPLTPPSRPQAPIAGLPVSGQQGIAGLRFTCSPSPGPTQSPGRIASPTVPIELVAERGAPEPIPAFPEEAAVPRVLGLDHVVVATRDPERARRFFGEALGIRLALDRSFPERGLRLLFFRLGGITIEVASTLAEQSSEPGQDVFHGLAWKVAGIDALHARLRDEGFGVSEIRTGHKPGTRVCSLREAVHGVPTLLIEHPPREDW